MKKIVYISTALKLMSDDELVSILKVARQNNTKRNLTGVLLYSGGTFIQVLEGEANEVDHIFNIIEQDARHKNVLKLIEENTNDRTFADWSMGFASVSPDKTNDLIGFLKSTHSLLNSNEQDNAIEMIKTFISANNLPVSY